MSFVLLVISGGLSVILFVLCIGGGGVLNDLDLALEEIQDLERNGLLNNPPAHVFAITKREIELGQNSTTLETYINETNMAVKNTENYFIGCIFLFFLSIMTTIFCRIKIKYSLSLNFWPGAINCI